MPSAYTSRDRSFCLLRSICSTTFRPTLPSFRGTARSDRGSRGVTTRFSSWVACRWYRSPKSRTSSCSINWSTSDSPSPSMFIALRDAKCSRPRRSRAGHAVFSQRQTTSSSSRCSALPHARHVVGITHGTASGGRRLRMGATTRGITSPGLLDDHRVAFAKVLPGDVLGVVQRRHRDRGARDEDRRQHRVGGIGPGPADVDIDPEQLGVRLLRGKLERRRPAGKLGGRPQSLAQRRDRRASRRRRQCRTRARAARPPRCGRTR